MSEEYFSYPESAKTRIDLLQLRKSQKVAEYFSKSKLVDDLNYYAVEKNGEVVMEIIVFEFICHSVPPINSAGINYKERLALEISKDDTILIRVLALRKNFPTLPHQNHTRQGCPKDLCLYFEPVDVVNRTWTVQSLLFRIQNWVVKSSLGILHADDQPLENQFFESKYELVLPFDYRDKANVKSSETLSIERVEIRKNSAETIIVSEGDNPNFKPFKIAKLFLPKIVHGQIYVHPSSLAEMHDYMATNRVDFHKAMQDALITHVEGGYTPLPDEMTFFLLHIPLCREANLEPEKLQILGLVSLKNIGEIGEALGIFNRGVGQDSSKYFATPIIGNITQSARTELWRTIEISPVSILFKNDPKQSRLQSGLSSEGPNGIIVGVGSLGSTLVDFWVRSGWGKWTIVDSDHIKPHNLSRHIATAEHIGLSKVEAVTRIADCINGGANPISSIEIDALKLLEGQYENKTKDAELILDFSTTLSYPRAASINRNLPRHISGFVTPSANAGVILAEDKSRECSMLTVEAQYYRALISHGWGENHLTGNNGKFWSGASCRDTSFVMAYNKIALFAALFCERIQEMYDIAEGEIVIFERTDDKGEIKIHSYQARNEVNAERGNFTVSYDEGLLEKLMRMRLENLPNETGGILLGYYDFNIRRIVVVDALPAPRDSISNRNSFTRGVEDQSEIVENINKKTANVVGYIGEWHSHPNGCSSFPSKEDIIQLCELSSNLAEEGLPAIQFIVSEQEISSLIAEYQSDKWIIQG